MNQHTHNPAVTTTGKHSTLRRHAENAAAAVIWACLAAAGALYPAVVLGYWIGA